MDYATAPAYGSGSSLSAGPQAPAQPLTLSVLERLNELQKGADQTLYSLMNTRDRLFGSAPELASAAGDTSEPAALSPQINDRFDRLQATMRRLDHLAETLNSRL